MPRFEAAGDGPGDALGIPVLRTKDASGCSCLVSHEDCLGNAVGPLLRSFATRCAPSGRTRGPSERSATAWADRPVLMGRLALSAPHIEREHRGNRTRARKMTAIELQDPMTGPTAERPHRPQVGHVLLATDLGEASSRATEQAITLQRATTRCSRSSPWRRRTTNGWAWSSASSWSGAAHAHRASWRRPSCGAAIRPTPSSRRPGPNDPTSPSSAHGTSLAGPFARQRLRQGGARGAMPRRDRPRLSRPVRGVRTPAITYRRRRCASSRHGRAPWTVPMSW